MNAIFTTVFTVCTVLLLIADPNAFLTTVLGGAQKSASLCLALLSSYALWLGLISVWEKSGVSEKISLALKPLAKKIFKTDDGETLTALSMNLSVNLLGVGGAATPYGIKAANLLDKTPQAEYASAMLFVINATSIQLVPTAIVGVRASLGSVSPADIILPSLLETALSTLLGVILTWLYFQWKDRHPFFFKRFKKQTDFFSPNVKIKGAGTK